LRNLSDVNLKGFNITLQNQYITLYNIMYDKQSKNDSVFMVET